MGGTSVGSVEDNIGLEFSGTTLGERYRDSRTKCFRPVWIGRRAFACSSFETYSSQTRLILYCLKLIKIRLVRKLFVRDISERVGSCGTNGDKIEMVCVRIMRTVSRII